MLNRRSLLLGLGAALAAPMVARASVLMPLRGEALRWADAVLVSADARWENVPVGLDLARTLQQACRIVRPGGLIVIAPDHVETVNGAMTLHLPFEPECVSILGNRAMIEADSFNFRGNGYYNGLTFVATRPR